MSQECSKADLFSMFSHGIQETPPRFQSSWIDRLLRHEALIYLVLKICKPSMNFKKKTK